MTKLHLHIGAHKTATTLIQKALLQDRDELEHTGTLVLLRGDIDPIGDGLARRWRAHDIPLSDLRPIWRALRKRMRKYDHVVMSYEELIGPLISFDRDGRLYPQALDVLDAFLGVVKPHKATAHFYVRRQDTFLESVYLQAVRGGFARGFSEWMSSLPPLRLQWTSVCDQIRAGTNTAPRVHYYEDIRRGARRFIERFYEESGCAIMPRLEFATRRQNRGYSASALDVVLAANRVLSGDERKTFGRFIDRTVSRPTDPRPALLGDDERVALLEALAADNQALHERFLLARSTSPYLPDAQLMEQSTPAHTED